MRRALLLLLVPTLAFASDPARQRALESNLATAVAIEGVRGQSLDERMKQLGVPAVSYAVVENGKIVLAAAYGEADLAAKREATPSTLFQAASISKPVTAIGVMELVERGKLSLDAPVNTILRTWQLPENELTAKTPVTLRLLLSHSAGTTVHGFPGYAPSDKRPTVAQILEGKPPANTAAVVVNLAPNTQFRYSGGGTTIVQAAVTDHTGLPFPTFMRNTVLRPLSMTASTYEQPLPPARRNEAATGYRLGGREVEGKWHVYPEMAAAGLWTTPSDLAKVIIEIQNALAGRPTNILTIDAARHMITQRFPTAPDGSEGMGIGFGVGQRSGVQYFSHGGANEGFRCILIATADGSHGAVVMTNADSGGRLMNEVVNTIAREYRWPGYSADPLRPASLGDPDAARFAGRYELESNVISIRRHDGRLEVLDPITGWQPLYPLADRTLARADRDVRYAAGADGLTVIADATAKSSKSSTAKRLAADAAPGGNELIAAGRVEEAMAAYREAFRKDPKSVPEGAINNLGYGFLNAGRTKEAIAVLQLNTELYPASANTYDSLADALIVAGETQKAIAAYEELLRRVDADPSAEANTKAMLKALAESRLQELRKK